MLFLILCTLSIILFYIWYSDTPLLSSCVMVAFKCMIWQKRIGEYVRSFSSLLRASNDCCPNFGPPRKVGSVAASTAKHLQGSKAWCQWKACGGIWSPGVFVLDVLVKITESKKSALACAYIRLLCGWVLHLCKCKLSRASIASPGRSSTGILQCSGLGPVVNLAKRLNSALRQKALAWLACGCTVKCTTLY